MSIFSFKMSTFVCVFICSISSCSPSQSPLVVDTSSIPMIPPTSLSLIHVCTQNLYILSLVSASWGVAGVLSAENTTPQHCGLINFSTHLTIPAPIKSMLQWISHHCSAQQKERPLSNNNYKSVYWKRIECSLYFWETVYQIHLNVNWQWESCEVDCMRVDIWVSDEVAFATITLILPKSTIQWSSNEMQLIKFEISQQLMLQFEWFQV